jgi:hypothetical protein
MLFVTKREPAISENRQRQLALCIRDPCQQAHVKFGAFESFLLDLARLAQLLAEPRRHAVSQGRSRRGSR